MQKLIKTNYQDGIFFVGLDRPPVNALSLDFIEQLTLIFEEINNNKNCRIVIINSLVNNFCAGADLKERKIMSLENADLALDKLNNCFNMIESCPVPTIAAINGFCLGGGAELALCCDFRIMEESATIGFPEVSIGIIPGAGGTQRLPKLTNISTAKYWIFSARKFTSEEALEDKVTDFIAPDGELIETSIELAEELMQNAPLSIIASKESINKSIETNNIEEALLNERRCYRKTLNTKDRIEALNAFSEKRKPKWRGQ